MRTFPAGAVRRGSGAATRATLCALAFACFACTNGPKLLVATDAGAAVGPGRLSDGGRAEAGGNLCVENPFPELALGPAPDLLIVFDRSASMAAEFGDGTRHDVETALLRELLSVYEDKIRFGFQPFPGNDGCGVGVATGCCAPAPLVGIGLEGAARIAAAMKATGEPAGNTPTADALRQARFYFERQTDRGDRYVLLSTDGRPSCTSGGGLARDAYDANGAPTSGPCHDALREVDALRAAGVKVIVLGVGPGLESDPSGRPSCLEEMALRGGAARPAGRPSFYGGENPEELERALEQIFGGIHRPECGISLQMTPANPAQVTVDLDGRHVPRSREHGWDYDPPDDRRRIRIFGEYCRRLARFQFTTVAVRFPCTACTTQQPGCE